MKRLFAVFIATGLLGCQTQEKPQFVEVNLEDKQHKLSYALSLNLSDQLKKQQGMAIDMDVFVQGFKDGYSEDEQYKRSYTLGLDLSDNLKKQQGMAIDMDVFVQGFKDGYSGESPLLSSDEALKILIEIEQEQRAQQQEQRAQQMARANKMAAENKKAGEAFLAENRKKEGVVTLDSGLQYKVIKASDGPKPTKTDSVVCHYRGTLLDGTEFDSSYSRGEPAQFRVDKLIFGWTEALQLMPAGSKWELYIPSYLAYGARQAGQISPNSTLIFELELLEIK